MQPHHSDATTDPGGLQCISGLVILDREQQLGAITGRIFPRFGSPVRIRQVVGPAGGPVSLTTVDGRCATVCGNFVVENGRLVLNVRRVIPGRPAETAALLVLVLLLLLLTTRL